MTTDDTSGAHRRRSLTGLLALALAGSAAALSLQAPPPASATTPSIGNVRTTAVGSTTATIAWDTDIASDTQVAYGATASYGLTTTLATAKVTTHAQGLTGLTPNQIYHYQVRSRDAAGDLAVSGDRTFGTPLGATTAGGSTDTSNSDGMNATRFTTTAGGKVTSLSANVGAVDPSVSRRSFQMAIYTASGNVPGTLVASSATGTLVANSWNTVPITATLAPATSYFFVYNTNGASSTVNNLRYTNGGTSGWRTAGQAYGTWPTSFGGFSAQAVTFSMYATFATDVTPPTVSVTAPADGASVNGTVPLTADAADEGGVASVQFKVGSTNLGAPDTSAPYTASWNTTGLANGPQTITAVATDTAGLTTASSPVAVTVNNPAKVAIQQPAAGSTVAGTSVTVVYRKLGDFVDGDGKHIHLQLDGGPTKMDFDTDGDHSYTFTDVPGGAHTVTAIVADGSHVEMPGSGDSVSFTSTAPDTSPPTVSLTAPNDGATVQNTVTVTAGATDDNGVVGVQFLLDGNVLGAEDTTAPYSVSWDTLTATNGAHTLRARARDSVNTTTSTPVDVTVANADPRATTGEWGPVVDWPIVSVHATLLHTGEILMWDGWELPAARAKLWNPTTNTFTDVTVPAGLFCAGQATDADGRLVTMGGHNGGEVGIKDVWSFDPVTRAWTKKKDMANARWYPSVTQLPDNRMVTLSGQKSPGVFADTPEIFTPTTNQVATLPISTPQMHEIQYPQTSVLPNGKLLAISAEQGSVMTLDPATNAWNNLGTTQVPYGAWTSFAPGKYLITGGGATFNSYDPNNPGPSQTKTRVLDMTGGSPVWSDGGSMANGRSFHNVTMLPTGEALTIGGSTTVNDYSATGTLTAEQWNPGTKTWRQVASPARPRMYHSVSILMPDGRVLSAGGGRLAPAPDQLNMQMYSPGYLFKGPRPTISDLPAQITHGSTMDLVSPQAADIAKVTLVDLASVTHTADWNQRFVDLPFTRSGTTLTVDTPANANIAPENYYMVFAVDSNGVPSTAKIVKLGGAPDTTAPVISDIATSAVSQSQATVTWSTNEAADAQVEYGTTTGYGASTTRDTTLETTHSQKLTGLDPSTTYHFRVKSSDAAGNPTVSGDRTFTTAALDTQDPTVAITAPSSGATVSGTTTVSATATDNVGVVGVQFRLDGAPLGAEDSTTPYAVDWSTAAVPNGSHTLTAVARDAAGRTGTSAAVPVTVANNGPPGLVAAFGFNEGTGTGFTDASGTGNNGTLFQTTWSTAGKFGKALSFDGSNDYASVPDAPSLDIADKMTLEAWVRPTISSAWRTVMLKEQGSSELAFAMYSASGTNRPSGWIRTNPTSGGSSSAVGTAAVPLNAWTHLAVTYDGAALKVFVNGTQVVSRPYTGQLYSTNDPLRLGGNLVWGEYFRGLIDEVRVYNRPLTAAQIQADMQAPL